MQMASSDVAEIMGSSNFDWVAIDIEHGTFGPSLLPDIFRALELGNTLPIVRVASHEVSECRRILDMGAGGVIIPNIENRFQIENIVNKIIFPPEGKRGVGFARENLFGLKFDRNYLQKFKPLIFAMVESVNAIKNLEDIAKTKFLDGILVGPYDLSANMNMIGNFTSSIFQKQIKQIIKICIKNNIAPGLHVVSSNAKDISRLVKIGIKFIPFGTDAMFLYKSIKKNI